MISGYRLIGAAMLAEGSLALAAGSTDAMDLGEQSPL